MGPPTGAGTYRRAGRLELADIVRAYGARFQRTHRLARVQRAALRAIAVCRTAVLGGHRETCDRCGEVRLSYNSCLMESKRFWGVRAPSRSHALSNRPVRRAVDSP